jgi:hypothetical protein
MPTNHSHTDLLQMLNNQLQLLSTSCLLYDEGQQYHGVEICHRLRVILHNTRNSHSFLHQLGMEDSDFISTHNPILNFQMVIGDKTVSNQYFLASENMNGEHQMLEYYPHLDNSRSAYLLPFTEWWDQEIICTVETGSFTRKGLVVDVFANKLGGSHLDPDIGLLNSQIASLDNELLKWDMFDQHGNPVQQVSSPFLATCRQVAHEVLLNFRRLLPTNVDTAPYFTSIDKYCFIGHNNPNWGSVAWDELIHKLGDCLVFTVVSTSTTDTFGLFTRVASDKFIVEEYEFVIIGKSGFISIAERGTITENIIPYKINDTYGYAVVEINGELKMVCICNGDVFYVSKHAPILPLKFKVFSKNGGSFTNPRVGTGHTVESLKDLL